MASACLLFFFTVAAGKKARTCACASLEKETRNKPLLWILLMMRERDTDSHTHTNTHAPRNNSIKKKRKEKISCSWKQNGRSSSFRASFRIAWMSSLYLPNSNNKITTAKKKKRLKKKRYSRSVLCFTAFLLRRGEKK